MKPIQKEMANKEKQLTISLLKEKLEKLTNKKVKLKESNNNGGLITFSQLVAKVKEHYSIDDSTDERFDQITNMDELIALLDSLGFNRGDEAYEFIFDAILIK